MTVYIVKVIFSKALDGFSIELDNAKVYAAVRGQSPVVDKTLQETTNIVFRMNVLIRGVIVYLPLVEKLWHWGS